MADHQREMYAEILECTETQTKCRIVIFEKNITFSIDGKDHRLVAASWLLEWNAHLDREWDNIRNTSAVIMQRFVAALDLLEVDQATIDEAIKIVKRYAEKL